MKNTFWAIFISLALGISFIFSAFYYWRTYVYSPQQDDLAKQFEMMESKLNDLSEKIEKKNWQQEMTALTELNGEVKVLLEKKNKELARQAAIPADWEIYSDEGWGLELAYPANWQIYEIDNLNYDNLIISEDNGQKIIFDKRTSLADWQILNKESGEVYTKLFDLLMADQREISVMWDFVGDYYYGDYQGYAYVEGAKIFNYGIMVETPGAVYQILMKGQDENLSEEEEIFLKSIKFLAPDQVRGDKLE